MISISSGSTAPRTFYIAKDIQFLAHEPIINKFRAYKVFLRYAGLCHP